MLARMMSKEARKGNDLGVKLSLLLTKSSSTELCKCFVSSSLSEVKNSSSKEICTRLSCSYRKKKEIIETIVKDTTKVYSYYE